MRHKERVKYLRLLTLFSLVSAFKYIFIFVFENITQNTTQFIFCNLMFNLMQNPSAIILKNEALLRIYTDIQNN